MKYLDITGLTKFWNKIKTLLNNKIDKIPDGLSSQFLKADGSVDDTEYLSKSGGTMSGPITVNQNKKIVLNTFKGIDADSNEVNARVGLDTNWFGDNVGAILCYTDKAEKQTALMVGPNNSYFYDGSTRRHLWHSGNVGSGSGLDADLLDGKHLSDIFVRSSTKAPSDMNEWNAYNDECSVYPVISPSLENNDLNVYTYGSLLNIFSPGNHRRGFQIYCPDKVGTTGRDLYIRSYYEQDGVDYWSGSWKRIAFTHSTVQAAHTLTTTGIIDDVDLDEYKTPGSNYYTVNHNNNIVNKPEGITQFNLTVLKGPGNYVYQILIANDFHIYARMYNNTTWSSWEKMVTSSDLSALEERISALENKQE